jgi:trehalose utilization protein
MASNVMAIDLETKNLSHEIGGWENTHMFLVSTAATWNGNVAKAYVEDDVISKIEANGYEVLPLSQLKYDSMSKQLKNIWTT